MMQKAEKLICPDCHTPNLERHIIEDGCWSACEACGYVAIEDERDQLRRDLRQCGHGLHGWPWGLSMGDGRDPQWDGQWIVFGADPATVISLSGKVKVRLRRDLRRARRAFCLATGFAVAFWVVAIWALWEWVR